MEVFNKSFWKFTLGFLGFIGGAVFLVFMAGFYEAEVLDKNEIKAAGADQGAEIGNYSGPMETSQNVRVDFSHKTKPIDWIPEYPPRPE